MNETTKVNIDNRLEELGKYLKIDTTENDWRERVDKELKEARLSYKIYRAFGVFIMTGAGLLMLITFFAKGENILGIEIKEDYFLYFMLIIIVSNLFIIGGKAELKSDRLKTFKLLHDLDKE